MKTPRATLIVCLAALCTCRAALAGAPEVSVSLEGRVDSSSFEPGKEYELILDLKLTLPEGLHFNAEAPMRCRVRGAKGVRVRAAKQAEGQPRIDVAFRVSRKSGRASFEAIIDVPVCDAKAEVCLLKQMRWSIAVADGTVTARLSKKGEAALVEGKVKVGEAAPTEGCVAKDASGKELRLGDMVGKRPLILMTYRAFW